MAADVPWLILLYQSATPPDLEQFSHADRDAREQTSNPPPSRDSRHTRQAPSIRSGPNALPKALLGQKTSRRPHGWLPDDADLATSHLFPIHLFPLSSGSDRGLITRRCMLNALASRPPSAISPLPLYRPLKRASKQASKQTTTRPRPQHLGLRTTDSASPEL